MANNLKSIKYSPASDNPLEALRDLGGSIVKSTVKATRDIARTSFENTFNTQSSIPKTREDSISAEIIDEENKRRKSERLRYIRERQEFTLYSRAEARTQKKINELLMEIKKLAQVTVALTRETSSLVVEQKIVNPGVYHVNFLTFVITLVREAREKVNESRLWLNALKSKKQKRKYWEMVKRHGTTFLLSDERTASTQAA